MCICRREFSEWCLGIFEKLSSDEFDKAWPIWQHFCFEMFSNGIVLCYPIILRIVYSEVEITESIKRKSMLITIIIHVVKTTEC